MKKLLQTLRRSVTITRANVRLRYAIRMADKAHARHGERFYVMPDHRDRLVVMRRNGMRRLRRRGYMDRRVRMSDMLKECFYCTPDRSNIPLTSKILEAKRVMYLQYVIRGKDKI